MDLDAKTAAALQRLETRKDPDPVPEVPPEPPRESRRGVELRLAVDQVRQGDRQWEEWHVYGPDGVEAPAREGLVVLLVTAARMVAASQGWPQPLWRAARGVMAACAAMDSAAKRGPG